QPLTVQDDLEARIVPRDHLEGDPLDRHVDTHLRTSVLVVEHAHGIGVAGPGAHGVAVSFPAHPLPEPGVRAALGPKAYPPGRQHDWPGCSGVRPHQETWRRR